MTDPNRPVLLIFAGAAAGILLMLWALYETNGPHSMDALRKPPQTTGSPSPSNR